MIAREWKCRVPEADSDGFTGYLYETGIKDSSATPGFLGAQIFRRSLAAKIELTLITYWDNLESIKAFAGNDISQARLYPEDEVMSLSLTFRFSTMKSSNISFRQSSGGKLVHLLCNQSFKFVPGLKAVHRTPFSPLRSKKVTA